MRASLLQSSRRCFQTTAKLQPPWFPTSSLLFSATTWIECINSTTSPIILHISISIAICFTFYPSASLLLAKLQPSNISQQLRSRFRDSECAAPSTTQRHPLHPVHPMRASVGRYSNSQLVPGEPSLEHSMLSRAMTGRRSRRPLPTDASLINRHRHSQSNQPIRNSQ
jgi:hypothetical protein